MKRQKKLREKSPSRPNRKGPTQKPGTGKFAPIIEELGRMKTRLEADASYLSTRPLSLQERTQIEIEGELLRKEEGVRVDFDAAFRQHPQVLVEMVSAMRRYGDADMMRNLVFAAETLYGDKLRELPGGIEFWEDLKREVAPLPHPPALSPSDLRLQRLQAIEIFRETIVSYDMLSDSTRPALADVPSNPEAVLPSLAQPGTVPKTSAPAEHAPDEPGPEAKPPVAEALLPQPEPPAEPEPSLTVPAATLEPPGPPAPKPPPDENAVRLDRMMQRIKEQEEALKKDHDGLLLREQRLLSLEQRLEEKHKDMLASEEQARTRLAGNEEELERLRRKEAELAGELERTQTLHQRTAEDLEVALKQSAGATASADALKDREEALARDRQKVEEERAGLQKLQEGLRAGEERLHGELRERQERLALDEQGLKARLELAEGELSAKRSELAGRDAALADTERTLREQERRLDEERMRLEAGKTALAIEQAPAVALPQAPPRASAATLQPAPPSAGAPVSEGSILGRLASLAAAPPEPRPVEEKPVPLPDIPPPEGEAPDRTVLYKVKCPGCKNIIPVYTRDRPLKIKCDACGKEGVLK